MVITIVAGPQEGKSGLAYWLSEQLKKYNANVTIHDSETTPDAAVQIQENYEKIAVYVAKTQDIHIITKPRPRTKTDQGIVSDLKKSTFLSAT